MLAILKSILRRLYVIDIKKDEHEQRISEVRTRGEEDSAFRLKPVNDNYKRTERKWIETRKLQTR